jgi:hypothetical protein
VKEVAKVPGSKKKELNNYTKFLEKPGNASFPVFFVLYLYAKIKFIEKLDVTIF